jgi:hypothetical protein
VALELEYLVEALEEAEAAARWYAERSATAAAADSDYWRSRLQPSQPWSG